VENSTETKTAASINPPACLRCKRPTNALAREGDRQRFECTGCSLTFWGEAIAEPVMDPKKAQQSFAFSPILMPEKTATDGAGPRAKCEKCLKPYFNLGKRYEQHIASCDGTKKFEEKAPRRRRALLDIPTPAQVYAGHVAALMARRASLEAEIRGIDSAVAELTTKLKGAGGPAQAPFVVGNTLTR
jgi:hypothetical protein